MEALAIDPFDSNRWMYGTGATIQGGRDLLKWDSTHNVTLQSMADGIEETAILGLISPPTGPHLLSAVGDLCGTQTNITFLPRPLEHRSQVLFIITLTVPYPRDSQTRHGPRAPTSILLAPSPMLLLGLAQIPEGLPQPKSFS